MAAKHTKEEMISLAFSLQEAVVALCGRRPLRITTNKDFKVLRIVWMKDFERKEWYQNVGMKILISAFTDKHGIPIREVTAEDDSRTAVYLTKEEFKKEKETNR